MKSSQAEAVETAKRWAEFYKARGFQPLPASTTEKRPLMRYAQWWEERAPEGLFDRFPSPNLQLMTGRFWRLLVLDLDGEQARQEYEKRVGPLPRTWITHSGGNGLHLWFSLPAGIERSVPKVVLWKGEEKHSAIERLCDRSVIMVPPSIHPTSGRPYRFAGPQFSPAKLPLPALCPRWLINWRPPQPEPPAIQQAVKRLLPATVGRYRDCDVLEAIQDKVALAESWGLRVATRHPNHAGWCSCHAIGREDRTPSAAISATTGRYWEPAERTISLFELGVRLGMYSDWRDAIADLGARFHAREAGR